MPTTLDPLLKLRAGGGDPAAIAAFQALRGLPATGVIDAATRDQLVLRPTPTRSKHVSVADTTLNALKSVLATDAASVRGVQRDLARFEQQNALPNDGVLGFEDVLVLMQTLVGREAAIASLRELATDVDPELYGSSIAWPIVKRGHTDSPSAELIQLRLNALGFGPLDPDGDFGEATETAVKAFQTANTLTPDGVAGGETWPLLMATQAVLHAGDKAPEVGVAQKLLTRLAYGNLGGSGTFGPQTTAALAQFQGEHGLPVAPEIDLPCWENLLGSDAVHVPADGIGAAKAELRATVGEALVQVEPPHRIAVAAVLDEAIATYGIREVPPHSNGGPDVEALVGSDHIWWCAAAVSAWLRRGLHAESWAGIPFGERLIAVNSIRAWGVAQGRFVGLDVVPPGAILILNTSSNVVTPPEVAFDHGHTGLALADMGDGDVLCIEGNSGDAVSVVRRKKSATVGYVRWW